MTPRTSIRQARLLLVTDPRPDLTERVEAGVRGGADVVQLRHKGLAGEELLAVAKELREICALGGALFTVNDDSDLARSCAAGGVHLGQEDEAVASARKALGPGAIIGRSVGSHEEALAAVAEGADYLGVGTVYATPPSQMPTLRARASSKR